MADNVNVLDVLGRAAGYILCEAGSESDDYLAMHDAIVRIAELIAADVKYDEAWDEYEDSEPEESIPLFHRAAEATKRREAALSACTGGSNG